MSKDYDAKAAIVDLGFVDGCCTGGDFLPRDWDMYEALLDIFDRIEEYVLNDHLDGATPKPNAYAHFLHDMGFVRGLLWTKPIPDAVSEALDRLLAYFVSNKEFPCALLTKQKIEPKDEMVSDQDRDLASLIVTGALDLAD